MPAKNEEQRKMMGAELARKRAGKKTKTGMSEKQLSDYASKPGRMGERAMTLKKMRKEHKKNMGK